MTSSPSVRVNGDQVALAGVPPHTTTLDWLRGCGLTGAKEGCAEGECGACSVLVARPGTDTPTEWTALNACLVPAAALDGQEIVTAEGLGDVSRLHPVQHELATRGGSQCGYCTPGFVCSMAAEYYRPGRGTATADEHHTADAEHGPNGFDLHALSGNLCRCTGYRPIRDAAYALDAPTDDDLLAARSSAEPPAPVATRYAVGGAEFVRPADLAEALELLAADPEAQVVSGSTDWGVEVNLRGARAATVVAVDRLPELRELEVGEDVIRLGAALSLSEIERLLAGRVPLLDAMFPQFASRLIRNGATLGGNLGTGSPIGDAPPALLALDASVVLTSRSGDRAVPLADYFTGYRTTVKAPDELIRAVELPLPLAGITAFHKIAKRRFDDISSVAVGHALDVVDGVVRRARIGLGGVAATPLRAVATEDALVGRPWTEATVRAAAEVLAGEGTPMDDHRASASYRSAMLGQSLLRLFAEHVEAEEVPA
ncbi:xanthine dehydrogenase small subunit [Nocardioides panacisoli]|uniref:FAD binding domain-containing protein n=1 Tax=Nocardioides panacisoli TaxID=627624 RepID=A0ABP7J2E5_9ACTN